ncbi:MAG: type II toxin-antitoxin system RatA family toxin [Gammaproteobacteria bacterium]|nr:type II toxin-antitoxin system RatA family toxin [Gammaproteobacteria bacterium]
MGNNPFLMREVSRSAIVPYPADAMYALVADVESYPKFLPGCSGSRVIRREADTLVASLSLARGPFNATFTTRNRLEPPARMTLDLVDGPFETLRGDWSFTPLGEQGCRVTLNMRFQFRGATRDWLLGSAFELTCGSLVDAFVARARAVYG